MSTSAPLEVEASGETVGEAKWVALRELQKLQPELDKSAVSFQVVSEGQRGLLGVGYAPARVIARVDPAAVVASLQPDPDESALVRRVREVLDRVASAIAGRVRIEIAEDDARVDVSIHGGDLGLLIGKHGQTIDAIQYLVNAIVYREQPETSKSVVVDVAGYRERRKAAVDGLAVRTAERVAATHEAVELEPMSAIERKLVHERLKDFPGVATRSEGVEPSRFVIVEPATD